MTPLYEPPTVRVVDRLEALALIALEADRLGTCAGALSRLLSAIRA